MTAFERMLEEERRRDRFETTVQLLVLLGIVALAWWLS